MNSDAWFQGGLEGAFTAAADRRCPLLLYWGAVWCPPCNELKTQVLATPAFAASVKARVVAFHLDGDAEGAQAAAERLGLTGYPTLVLYGPDGRERTRFVESMDGAEWTAALSAALEDGGTLDAACDVALAGQATDAQWRLLASFPWAAGEGTRRRGAALAEAPLQLARQAPERLVAERAMLAASALQGLAHANLENEDAARLRREARPLLEILLHPASAYAARGALVQQPAALVRWLFLDAVSGRDAAIARWTVAVAHLAAELRSIDLKLWAGCVPLDFFRLQNPGEPVPAAIRAQVRHAVVAADRAAKTPEERKAVVSHAVYQLRTIGAFDDARALLDRELKTTSTPWYYQSAYAALERAAGRADAMLAWNAAATASVQGRASKLQWLVDDLVATAKVPGHEARAQELLAAYHALAASLSDGKAGRNASRAARVEALFGTRA